MAFNWKKEAKFLSTRMDEKTAKSVGLANLMVLGATLAHDGTISIRHTDGSTEFHWSCLLSTCLFT